jgi:hypothetical protein
VEKRKKEAARGRYVNIFAPIWVDFLYKPLIERYVVK